MILVIIIIIVTGIISFLGFSSEKIFNAFSLQPYMIVKRFQIYRNLTHGLLHGSWSHLIINMLVFYSFGSLIVEIFCEIWDNSGYFLFILLYFSAIIVSSIFSTIKHRNNPYYVAIGASGATSAIIFCSILFAPWNKIYFFGIIPIPAIFFGGIYLIYCFIMGRRGKDNIGHDAHFWGAIYGFLFPLIFKPSIISYFFSQLLTIKF